MTNKDFMPENLFNDISDTLKDLEIVESHYEALKSYSIEDSSHETILHWRKKLQE